MYLINLKDDDNDKNIFRDQIVKNNAMSLTKYFKQQQNNYE